MKKALIALFAMGTLLSAAEYSKEDRIKDMQQMEIDMALIQKGFLYNDVNMITQGANNLKNTVSKVEPPKGDMDKLAPGFSSYKYKFGQKDAAKIAKLTDRMVENFKIKRPNQATREYNTILKDCMACHVKLRKK